MERWMLGLVMGAFILLSGCSGGVEPSIQVGEIVEVPIIITDADDLYAFQFDVIYDPEILEFIETRKGDFLKEPFTVNPVPSDGRLRDIAATMVGDKTGVDGSGTLVTIVFETVAPGESKIEIADSKFLTSDRQTVNASLAEQTVRVG